ncbi:TetR/AcrR family transcriptional regulator [Diaminobutyricimonas sp. LJ205]|uniref:TetR/AcrR family transcriptional regulator n=1 Tax=Diaminobutyricimonas sp. LJ205 TaxID=2683590 RepID=UPI001E3872F8|nr:TetR/AcrR family transcriptional regulator [Diaminobutyricimonas sp. LJ205]
MRSAAKLFAERGFAAVSTVDLGDAVGMSGPALYNYFPSKESLLAELLIDASERLLNGCQSILADTDNPDEALTLLIKFHLEFATADPDIIRIQDRELPQLAVDVSHRVRRLQRQYVQTWDEVLRQLRPALDDDERQTRLLATFGLLNSTPHSAQGTEGRAGPILAGMARRALLD